jgi:hypothetical protein
MALSSFSYNSARCTTLLLLLPLLAVVVVVVVVVVGGGGGGGDDSDGGGNTTMDNKTQLANTNKMVLNLRTGIQDNQLLPAAAFTNNGGFFKSNSPISSVSWYNSNSKRRSLARSGDGIAICLEWDSVVALF